MNKQLSKNISKHNCDFVGIRRFQSFLPFLHEHLRIWLPKMWLHHAAVDNHLRGRPLVVPPTLHPRSSWKPRRCCLPFNHSWLQGAIKTSQGKQIWWSFVSPSFVQAALRVTYSKQHPAHHPSPEERDMYKHNSKHPVESRRLCCLLFGPIFHLATKL